MTKDPHLLYLDAMAILEMVGRKIGREPNQQTRRRIHEAQYLLDKACVALADGPIIGGREEA